MRHWPHFFYMQKIMKTLQLKVIYLNQMRRVMQRKKLFIVIVVLIVIVAVSYFVIKPKAAETLGSEANAVCTTGEGCSVSDKRVKGFNVGDQLPNIELTTFDGKVDNLYDLIKGKDKFIISLAVDWCSDCKRQDEKLDEYYNDLPQNYGAAVIFVDYTSSDGSKTTNYDQAKKFVEDEDYSFQTYWDRNNKIANKFGGVKATPTNIVLDENAIIKAKTEEIDMDNLFQTNETEYNDSFLK